MSTAPTTLRGYVAPLPTGQICRVALICTDNGDETEYPVLPRGAGIDLADMVSAQLEVVCAIQEENEGKRLLVRSYQVLDSLDEDVWYGDEA